MKRRAKESGARRKEEAIEGGIGGSTRREEDSGWSGPLKTAGRWSADRKKKVVLRLLRGESVEAVTREIGVVFSDNEKSPVTKTIFPAVEGGDQFVAESNNTRNRRRLLGDGNGPTSEETDGRAEQERANR